MANINISQILMKRGNTAAASTYTGPLGELVVDTGLQTIRIQDGVTAGGWVVTGGGGNVDLSGINNSIASLTANASTQQNQITSLRANITAANSAIASKTTAGYVDSAISTAINNLINSAPGTLDTLGEIAANLATEGSAIAAITNSITAANTRIQTLNANVGSFYTWANANYSTSSTTNSLVNGDQTLTLNSDGTVTMPLGSVVKAATDSYTGIATHDSNTFAYVNADGFYVSTLYNTEEYEWQFDNTGKLTLPASGIMQGPTDGSGASSYVKLSTSGETRLASDNGNVEIWATAIGNSAAVFNFSTDGNLTLPTSGAINYANGQSILSGISSSGNTFDSITMTNTPGGPSNQIKYGTGNLVVYQDGGWALGVYDGTAFGTEGMRLSPGIEGNVEVILPADQYASTNPLELNNYAGNVQVRASNNYWTFGGDGNLTIAGNINYANGQSILSGISTATRWDAIPAVEGCPIYAELTPDHFSAYTQHSHLDVNNNGSWDIGSNYLSTGLYSLDNTAVTLYSNLGNVVVRTGDSSQYWTFGGDGELYLPTGGRLGYAGKGWTGLDGGYGNPTSLTSYYSSEMYSSCITLLPNGSLNISTYGDGTGQTGNWNFSGGAITFPDNTVQTTAYQAGSAGNAIIEGNISARVSSTEFRVQAGDKSYWIAQFGDITNGNRADDGNSIVYDSQSNLIVVVTDYAEVPGDNTPKPIVVKYNPEGQVIWNKYLSAGGSYIIGSSESVDVDGQDNIYVLTNNYDTNSSGVFKISPAGELLDQIQIDNTSNNMYDIVVDSDGNYYLSGVGPNNGNNQLSVIKGNFSGITWQTGVNYQTGSYDYGYSIAIDSATPPNVYVAGACDVGGELVKLDHTGTVQWAVTLQNAYFDSLDVDNAGNIYVLATFDGDAIVVKYDNSGNVIWQEDLHNVYNPTEIQVGADGYLYATGITGNGPFNNAIWMAKLDTSGAVQWVRGLTNQVTYNNIGQWNNAGHKDIAVGNGVFAVTGFSQNSTRGGGGYVPHQAVVAQFPTDGTYALPWDDRKTYLNYSYITLPWMESSSNTSFAAATATFVTADPGYASTASNANLTVSTVTTSVESIIHGAIWKFNEAGNMVFPDKTVQSTAYPGPGSYNIGEYAGVTPNSGDWQNVPISIKNATGYRRITGLDSSTQTWLSLDDVGAELGINPGWISGMVIDYQAFNAIYNWGGSSSAYGNMVGQIILAYNNNGNRMTVTHSETASTVNDGTSYVFTNLDLWNVDGNTLNARRTDNLTGQQLDIMWTAKVFINPSEYFC